MKYIDADKLIINLERQNVDKKIIEPVIRIIRSLQQEQPEMNLENEIKDYTETLYHETFGNGQCTLDEFDWEDIAQTIDETARYFYKLGLNARKEE